MTYWQIAAGYWGRNYADSFLKYGMALVGGAQQTAAMEQVSLGDVLLLKNGVTEVVAVGRIV